ncbi:MAG: CRISPR-associated endonuclease Cas1 [Desulfobacterales bacterium]
METLYTLEPGSYLRKDGDCLKVIKEKSVIDQIPAAHLKKLVLSGYVSLSGAVLDFLIKNRIETVFITPTGRFRARLMIDEHKHVKLRQSQYLKLSDPSFARQVMRRIVHGKIANMARFLRMRGVNYNNDPLTTASAQLKMFEAKLAEADTPETLRGMEGAATRIFYSVFGEMIRNPDFSFKGRNRRPPRDPVNALLSFVYTLLTNEVLSAIKVCGLDPYMGSLHEIAYGRPSLACDLVEEYRCHLGDRFVLGLINRHMIQPDDFVYRHISKDPAAVVDEQELKQSRPVEMKPETNRTFIAAYEAMMARRFHFKPDGSRITYRQLIHNQVRRFAEFLTAPENDYQPFIPEK